MLYKILFASPVGEGCQDLLPATLHSFQSSGSDIVLFHYDDSDLSCSINTAATIHKGRGMKWDLAKYHISVQLADAYDYIFLWDDDIEINSEVLGFSEDLVCIGGHFNPQKFCSIMARNRLSLAQPAIKSKFPLSHKITAVDDDYSIGRLTNFVEIMCPVFARDAWIKMRSYITEDNPTAWGYDYVPFSRRGVVDCMPVTHTRAVRSGGQETINRQDQFLRKHSLLQYTPENLGTLV